MVSFYADQPKNNPQKEIENFQSKSRTSHFFYIIFFFARPRLCVLDLAHQHIPKAVAAIASSSGS